MKDWQASGSRRAPADPSISKTTAGPRQVSRAPMHVAVTERVRDLIVEGRMRPGERINENDLADFLGVSRTPLRDALKVLRDESLIVIEPHRGTYVSHLTVEHTAELFEALAGIERVCGELATRKITEEQLLWFAELHQQMFAFHGSDKLQDYFELNERIHRSYVSLSQNEILAEIHGKLIVGAKRARIAAIRSQERWDESVAEHKAIYTAVERRDAETTGRLIEQHVRHTGEFVCGKLKEAEVEAAAPRPRRARIYARRPGFAE